jgi:hypothetical protein
MTCSGCESGIRDGQMLASASLTILRVKRWGYFSLSLWSFAFLMQLGVAPEQNEVINLGSEHGHRFIV